MTDELLYTKSDVAKVLGVTPAAVREMDRRGKLKPAEIVGKTRMRLYKESDVIRLAEDRTSAKLRVTDSSEWRNTMTENEFGEGCECDSCRRERGSGD